LWVLGLGPSVVQADAKPAGPYDVKPSTQTVKRREAVLALSQSNDGPQAAPGLLEALKDKDPMTRMLALQGLGSLKYKDARPQLAERLAADPNAQVRETAAVSLRQIEDPQAVDALVKALHDPVMNVRVTALMGLGRYRDPKTRSAVEAMTKDKAPEVRRTALYAISRIGDRASSPVVQLLLKDADIPVRAGAAQTLGELRAADSKGLLEALLKDPNASVQVSAARSLLMLGDSTGFEKAKSFSRDPDIAVRLIAIDALGWSKDPEAESDLNTLLTETPANSRMAVQESLLRTQQLRKR